MTPTSATPAISVIIPVYNAERYLRQCLDSIAAQCRYADCDGADCEVIIIDDGSTDSSGAIADQYAQAQPDRFMVIHRANGGLSAARNSGIEAARGSWLSFVDADDCLSPHALALLLHIAHRDDADIAIGAHCADNDALRHAPCDAEAAISTVLTPHQAIEHCLYQDGVLTCSVCGRLFARHIFDTLRFAEGTYYEDLLITPHAFMAARRISVTATPIYYYRHNPQSFINTWSPKRLDVLAVTAHIEQYIAANAPALLPAARDRRLSANFNMYVLAARRGDNAVMGDTWQQIRRLRRASMLNSRVRLKNKVACLASYAGRACFRLLSRLTAR